MKIFEKNIWVEKDNLHVWVITVEQDHPRYWMQSMVELWTGNGFIDFERIHDGSRREGVYTKIGLEELQCFRFIGNERRCTDGSVSKKIEE